MDRHYIRDAQIIERYLRGTLTVAEEEAFEEAYLADADLLRDLKAAERLRDGLRDMDVASVEPAAPPRRPRWLEVFASPGYGIAASVVAAAALLTSGAMLVQNRGLPSGQGFAASGHTRLLPLVSVRGDRNPNVVAAPAADEWVVLLLDDARADYDRYAAVLVRRDGGGEREVLALDGLAPTYEGMIALGLPGRMLAPGDYEVRLAGGRRDWPTDRALDELSRTPLTVTPGP